MSSNKGSKRVVSKSLLESIPPKVKAYFNEDLTVHTDMSYQQGNVRKSRYSMTQTEATPRWDTSFLTSVINTCREGVRGGYIEDALSEGVKNPTTLDNKHELVVITNVTSDAKVYGPINHEDVLGFMLLYTGECGTHPNIPVLQIICSNGKNKKVASYLIYLYLKGLMSQGITMGLLEVAGGYDNAGALCLYNKFGFRENASLDTPDCFEESAKGDTLAMSVDLADPKYTDGALDAVVLGGTAIQIAEDGEPMCVKKTDIGPGGTKQKKYIKNRTDSRYIVLNNVNAENIESYMEEQQVEYKNNINVAKRHLIKKGQQLAVTEGKSLPRPARVIRRTKRKRVEFDHSSPSTEKRIRASRPRASRPRASRKSRAGIPRASRKSRASIPRASRPSRASIPRTSRPRASRQPRAYMYGGHSGKKRHRTVHRTRQRTRQRTRKRVKRRTHHRI
jgi:hypothetical protein